MCGCTGNGSFAARPVRCTIAENQAVVVGVPASVTNNKVPKACSGRSARSSGPCRGWTLSMPPLARLMCWTLECLHRHRQSPPKERSPLAVQNMFCADCPFIVKKSLEAVPGVARSTVSFKDKTAIVTYDDGRANVKSLTEATTNAGFPSAPKS